MPLAPARWFDTGSHLGVEEDHGCVGAPGSTKIDMGFSRFGGEAAMVEDEGGLLIGKILALRGQVAACGMERTANLAFMEDGVAVAIDEVDVPGNDTVGKVTACGFRGTGCGGGWSGLRSRRGRCRGWSRCSPASCLATAAGADVERVLVREDADVVEDVSVAFQVKRLGLRAQRTLVRGCG